MAEGARSGQRPAALFAGLLAVLLPGDQAVRADAPALQPAPHACENILAPLELKGAGVRRHSVFSFTTQVYAVLLYGPEDVSLAHLRQAKHESAAIIEILRDDLPDKMPDELRDMLEPALGPIEMAKLVAAYRRLGESDRVTIDYEPGAGTRIAINGAVVARAESRDLMDDILEAWLGPDAISEPLRRRLMSGDIPENVPNIRRAVVCNTNVR